MKRNIIFSLMLIFVGITSLKAQVDSVFLSGKIYDYETQEILKAATFIHNGEVKKLSDNGDFNCYIKAGDTLSFRYTGHENYTIIVGDDLEKMTYISGIFLNQQAINHSEFILKPRLHNAKSFANYDPLKLEQMMNNAKHTLDIANYQSKRAQEWDAYDNQKYTMQQKEEAIEYKSAIGPSQQARISSTAYLYDPLNTWKLKRELATKKKMTPQLSAAEELYLKTLFLNKTSQ